MKPWFRWRRGKKVVVNSGAATVEIVAADSTKRYRLLRLVLGNTGGAATIQFKSDTTAITGIYDLANPDLFVYDFIGGENCTTGEALNLVITGVSAAVKGDIWYEEI